MVALARLRATWSGSPVVGPGVSTFYFDSADTGASTSLLDFFDTSPIAFPAGLIITIPSGGEIIDSVTGELAGTWNDPGTGGTVTGTNTAAFAKGVGMQVRWATSGIVGGRRVVGSTFLAPLSSGNFDTDGTLTSAVVTAWQAAANNMLTDGVDWKIWSRPKPGRGGEANSIISATIPDRPSWLRSRRV